MRTPDERHKIDQMLRNTVNANMSRRTMVQRAAILGASASTLPLAFSGTSGVSAQDRSTLRFGAPDADITSLDPHVATTTTDRTIVDMIFTGLIRFVPGTSREFEPDIATEMPTATTNDDGTQTWTVRLRDDVMVHPSEAAGTESYQLTADDVIFSFQKAANPDTSSYSANYEGWSFEAVDELTVEITLDQPISETLFYPNIANYSGGFIIPQVPFEALGADGFVTAPVGTGPFMLESYTTQNSVVLTAFDEFYRGTPELAGVEVRFIADATSRELALLSGDLDVIHGLPEAQWVERINEQPGFAADVFGVGEVVFLNINTTVEPFDDPLVREAVIMALSRENHIALSGEPVGEAVFSPVPAQLMPGGLTEEEAKEADVNFPSNPEQAQALLEEAGYPDGFEVDLVTSEQDSYRRNYEVLAEELRQIGITVNLEVVQHQAYHDLIRQDENPLTFYIAYRPNAHVYLSQFFTQDGGPTNFSKFDVSEYVDQALATTDPDEQAQLWKEANIALQENFAGYGLYLVNQVYARAEYVDYGHELNAVVNLYPGITERTSMSGGS